MSSPSPPASRKSSLAAGGGAISWQQVQVAIVALGEPADADQLDLLCSLLERFVAENLEPTRSPHLRSTAPDRLDPLVTLLARTDVTWVCPQARLLALQALKILARRQDIRLRCTQHVLDVVAPMLDTGGSTGAGAKGRPASSVGPLAASLASEAANALSNLCYEPANATGLVQAGGAPRLLSLLGAGAAGPEAHANAAGALQTLSFTQDGRAALLKAGGPAAVLHRLASTHSFGNSGAGGACAVPDGSSSAGAGAAAGASAGKLQQRLMGAVHNLSSSADGIAAIRHNGGIALIVALLASREKGVAPSAAGALQNMSREAQARADIRAQPGALPALAELLTGTDVQAAVCAAGTLANLCEGAAGAQDALASCLAGALAGGAIYHSLGAGQGPAASTT